MAEVGEGRKSPSRLQPAASMGTWDMCVGGKT